MPNNYFQPESELLGKHFDKLIVLSYNGIGKFNQRTWLCECSCGKKVVRSTNYLHAKGKRKSCGCYRKEIKGNTKHGLCYSRLNGIYRRMKQRCYSPYATEYDNYGGRGIKICDEWLGEDGFVNFYKWSMKNGYSDSLSIDRINNDGNYEPSNCRWADKITQANNTRANKYIEHDGEIHTVAEWARIKNVPYEKFRTRMKKLGWSFEEAVVGRKNK